MSSIFLRDVIGEYLCKMAERDERIIAVSADMNSTCRLNSFREMYPDRLYSVGIAEQNMISFSAGLAHEGFIPFAFTMAPFMSMRACEQIRTDVAYDNLNVVLNAPYAGVSGGISGPTHWGMEDCAIISSFPNMTVLEPCDPIQTRKLLDESIRVEGPKYLRTSVESVEEIYDESCKIEIGKANVVNSGKDASIICSGICVKNALVAARKIEKEIGASIRVVDMHTIKPIDRKAIMEAAETGTIVVAQDHSVIGGLGQQVATVLAESKLSVNFKILGIPDTFSSMAHAPFLYNKFGYDSYGIENALLDFLKK